MTEASAAVVTTGLVFGVGLWLIYLGLPFMRRTTFTQRVEPQLRHVDSRSKLLQEESSAMFGPLERLFRLVLLDVVGHLRRFDVSVKGLQSRLDQAGREQSPLEFRALQFMWAALGLFAGLALSLLLLWTGKGNIVGVLAITLALMLMGYVGYEQHLGAVIKRRQARMLSEFPAIAELIALAVGAGENAASALDRVARQSHGELSEEFSAILAKTRAGTPFIEALTAFAEKIKVPAISRFVDGISVAIHRGTPLADVLRAQAQDVRDVAKRELMEAAGRKEIGMMIPLIFGVLPLTVVFAVFPGLALLRIGL